MSYPFNPYMPPYYNPYQPQQAVNPQQAQQPQTNVYAFVNGIEGAKSFRMEPNQSIMLMDSEQPILYKKTTDRYGQASIEYFKITQIDEKTARGSSGVASDQFVLKSDFEKLVSVVNSLLPKKDEDPK